ncbi:MAG: haloacid dehalogenase-like hydrolase [Thiohalocapsa sp.]|nr:haloacid dehalogenase-like hydrolase [Thiohalocapsa sp.]MCF7991982.1 haloacid dehalogenase-like hydrolase [Thiohalocapsa sp.]
MRILPVLCLLLSAFVLSPASAADPLPSWNDGAAKTAITEFVAAVADPEHADYVAPSERIAVFDNDGALWVEQPIYTQLAFVLERLKTMAPQHPEWQEQQPFKAALAGDMDSVGDAGMEGLMQLLMATHAGMSTDEFAAVATDWLATARHPRFERPYTELVYQPTLELLDYLRANGFKTFIVSGGGIAFMRPWTERVYGIPPEQVVGSQIALKYSTDLGTPVIMRKPEIAFIDDKAGKPVGIQRHIGRRPIFAWGNSDGDYQMLQWTTAGDGRRLGMLLHHDDAEREYAYDRDSHVGRLDRGLDDAAGKGWVVVSMQRDWGSVFPAAPSQALAHP